jgi:limonene-1,2-epoxide hydrolase
MDNERIIREFIEAWSRLDADELASAFAADGVYHNMPAAPVSGRDSIRHMIAAFIRPWTETHWEILNLVSRGDIVVAERIDRTRAGDRSVDLPCTGVFQLDNGKITIWRDYFDMGTYTRAMT